MSQNQQNQKYYHYPVVEKGHGPAKLPDNFLDLMQQQEMYPMGFPPPQQPMQGFQPPDTSRPPPSLGQLNTQMTQQAQQQLPMQMVPWNENLESNAPQQEFGPSGFYNAAQYQQPQDLHSVNDPHLPYYILQPLMQEEHNMNGQVAPITDSNGNMKNPGPNATEMPPNQQSLIDLAPLPDEGPDAAILSRLVDLESNVAQLFSMFFYAYQQQSEKLNCGQELVDSEKISANGATLESGEKLDSTSNQKDCKEEVRDDSDELKRVNQKVDELDEKLIKMICLFEEKNNQIRDLTQTLVTMRADYECLKNMLYSIQKETDSVQRTDQSTSTITLELSVAPSIEDHSIEHTENHTISVLAGPTTDACGTLRHESDAIHLDSTSDSEKELVVYLLPETEVETGDSSTLDIQLGLPADTVPLDNHSSTVIDTSSDALNAPSIAQQSVSEQPDVKKMNFADIVKRDNRKVSLANGTSSCNPDVIKQKQEVTVFNVLTSTPDKFNASQTQQYAATPSQPSAEVADSPIVELPWEEVRSKKPNHGRKLTIDKFHQNVTTEKILPAEKSPKKVVSPTVDPKEETDEDTFESAPNVPSTSGPVEESTKVSKKRKNKSRKKRNAQKAETKQKSPIDKECSDDEPIQLNTVLGVKEIDFYLQQRRLGKVPAPKKRNTQKMEPSIDYICEIYKYKNGSSYKPFSYDKVAQLLEECKKATVCSETTIFYEWMAEFNKVPQNKKVIRDDISYIMRNCKDQKIDCDEIGIYFDVVTEYVYCIFWDSIRSYSEKQYGLRYQKKKDKGNMSQIEEKIMKKAIAEANEKREKDGKTGDVELTPVERESFLETPLFGQRIQYHADDFRSALTDIAMYYHALSNSRELSAHPKSQKVLDFDFYHLSEMYKDLKEEDSRTAFQDIESAYFQSIFKF